MDVASNVNVPVESDSLAAQIASALSRHPTLYYSTQLENSHIPAHHFMVSLSGDPFADTFNAYNAALFDSARQMIRYEKSLTAWSTIVADIDSKDVRNTLIMDYVYPVFRFLADIPNVFKDQLVRACVKLATISKGDYSLVNIDTAKNEAPRCDWFKELQRSCSDSTLGNQLITIINGDLFNHPNAKHFREFHGHAVHDLTPTLVSGVNQSYSRVLPFLSKPIQRRSICPMSLMLSIGTDYASKTPMCYLATTPPHYSVTTKISWQRGTRAKIVLVTCTNFAGRCFSVARPSIIQLKLTEPYLRCRRPW